MNIPMDEAPPRTSSGTPFATALAMMAQTLGNPRHEAKPRVVVIWDNASISPVAYPWDHIIRVVYIVTPLQEGIE